MKRLGRPQKGSAKGKGEGARGQRAGARGVCGGSVKPKNENETKQNVINIKSNAN